MNLIRLILHSFVFLFIMILNSYSQDIVADLKKAVADAKKRESQNQTYICEIKTIIPLGKSNQESNSTYSIKKLAGMILVKKNENDTIIGLE